MKSLIFITNYYCKKSALFHSRFYLVPAEESNEGKDRSDFHAFFYLFFSPPSKGEEIAGEFKEKMKISVAKSVVSIPRLAASFLEDSRFFKISKVLGEEDISRDISGIILGTDVSVVAERGDTHTHIYTREFIFIRGT